MSGHIDNHIVIDAPLELTWRMANDVASWPELFEAEYASAEVLHRERNRLLFRLTTVPTDDGRTFSWVSERMLDEESHTVLARRVELGPFRYLHIYQSFEEGPTVVLVRWVQDFEVSDAAPFTDDQMVTRINLNSRVQLQNHKKLIEAAAAG
jgi:aromatase